MDTYNFQIETLALTYQNYGMVCKWAERCFGVLELWIEGKVDNITEYKRGGKTKVKCNFFRICIAHCIVYV